jgi:hypothetical protein
LPARRAAETRHLHGLAMPLDVRIPNRFELFLKVWRIFQNNRRPSRVFCEISFQA